MQEQFYAPTELRKSSWIAVGGEEGAISWSRCLDLDVTLDRAFVSGNLAEHRPAARGEERMVFLMKILRHPRGERREVRKKEKRCLLGCVSAALQGVRRP